MDRKAAKELLHIDGWLDRSAQIVERGKDAYLADDLLQEAGDSLMMKADLADALGAEATPVRVAARWTGTWTANGKPRGPLARQPAPVAATADIRVDEVQTVVTNAG
jgi:hypothetical protein